MAKKPVKRTTGVCPKCKKVVPCTPVIQNIVTCINWIVFIIMMFDSGFDIFISGFVTLIVMAFLQSIAGIFGYKCDYCGLRVKKVR